MKFKTGILVLFLVFTWVFMKNAAAGDKDKILIFIYFQIFYFNSKLFFFFWPLLLQRFAMELVKVHWPASFDIFKF